jgi:hypothetical protein
VKSKHARHFAQDASEQLQLCLNLRVYNRNMTTYPLPSDQLWRSLKEGSEFFQHEGDIYATLRRLVDELDENGLDYALIGGLALVAHGYRRFTEDIDILMTPEALQVFRDRLLGRGYLPAFSGATKAFRDTRSGVRIEVITTGEYPGDGKPKPVAFPAPADVRTLGPASIERSRRCARIDRALEIATRTCREPRRQRA